MNSLNLIIAEDNAIIRMYMEQFLKDAGHRIVGTASNGQSVLLQVKEKNPDLVLLDVGLKGEIDGIETALELRAEYNTPVIFITGNSDRLKNESRLKEIQPIASFIKPIDEKELITALAEYHQRKQIGDK